MKKSMEKKGGKEAEIAKTLIRIRNKRSGDLRPRRRAFQIRPSRLSTMSDAHDSPITQPGQISPNSQDNPPGQISPNSEDNPPGQISPNSQDNQNHSSVCLGLDSIDEH